MSEEISIRPVIEQLPGYKAGASAPQLTGFTPYKLSSNENPFNPLPGVLAEISKSLADVNRYPDPLATELTNRLAAELGVAAEAIALGTGSVGVCQQIVQALCDAGDEVIFAWRSFEAYPIITTIAGAKSVQVPLASDGAHDLAAMVQAITERTKLIFICTPNNPTGNIVKHSQLLEFLANVPKHILVVIDEAYVEFNRDNQAVKSLELFGTFPNVAVLRTFSKAYGLAGLRVGFVVAPKSVAAAVRKTAVPFGVSNVAQAGAIASLDRQEELQDRIAKVIETRTWFEEQLKNLGFVVPESQANFIWLGLAEKSQSFAQECNEVAIAVRCFPNEGIRITIGERVALEQLLPICARYAPSN